MLVYWATAVAHMSICVMASRDHIRVTSVWSSEESRIVNWLNDDYQPDMEVQEDSDDGEVDQVTEEIHHSNTEEVEDNATVEDSETVTSDEERNVVGSKYFFGKDSFKCRKDMPPQNVRTREHNIVMHLPGPKGNARNAKYELECLELFLDYNIVKTITACTNIYIEEELSNRINHRFRKNFSQILNVKDMTLVSYCPKKYKAVLVLSSMHQDQKTDVDVAIHKNLPWSPLTIALRYAWKNV
ncbi:hypothetical protein C0J52_18272 [Blattella germanica]|nr:hypothetical protein C0J52_18272 [Blattella germanica]